MNTKIEYLYRDADNYKAYNSCVISGELTQDQIDTLVGLPDGRRILRSPHGRLTGKEV